VKLFCGTAAFLAIAIGMGTGCKQSATWSAQPDAGASQPRTCDGLPALAEKESYVVGFVQVYGSRNPWNIANTADMIAQAEKRGHRLVYNPPSSEGPEEQRERLRALIKARVDAIVLRPVDATSLVPDVLAARDACIPVFTIIRLLDPALASAGKDYVTAISADGEVQGQMLADWLIKARDGRAQIVEVEGPPGASSAMDRKRGFDQRVAQQPGMQIVASKAGTFERESGHDTAKELLSLCPECNVVYAHNDNMALGALAAIRERGKAPGRDVMVVGVDGLREAVKDVMDGTMAATVFNDPRVGAITFTTIERYGKGNAIPRQIVVKGPVIDRNNAPTMIAEAF
jgi:ribose transport system substrate-binding protein